MKTIYNQNSVIGPKGRVEVTTTYHSTKNRINYFRTVAVCDLTGLISEAKSYSGNASVELHEEILNAALSGTDCHVPNDVKYYRAKTAS